MPPKGKKKGAEEETRPKILGRLGTSLKIGILGLPNVGKSTFFNVLTDQHVDAENYPFCTIEPNEAIVKVPDDRFDYLCEHHKPMSKVQATLTVTDIAGLVKGAHEGKGLGNAFLSHINACDALFHMLRIFKDKDVTHVEGEVDPARDLDIIQDELRMKDIEMVNKYLDELLPKYNRAGTDAKKGMQVKHDCLQKVKKLLEDDKKAIRFASWSGAEIDELNDRLFLTAKPQIYLCNMSEKAYITQTGTKPLKMIMQWIEANDPGSLLIPYSATYEHAIMGKDEAGIKEYLAEKAKKWTKDGKVPKVAGPSKLNKIITQGFSALGLEVFFTAGKDEVKAWTIKKNTSAPKAAGRIHTDFERGFIMAETMAFKHFKEAGSESAAKAAGNYNQKGKTYVVQDGDIIFFKFNVTAPAKAKK